MEDLTFGEQVKIVLGRRGMTIKRLAELIEERTGKKMSRQNLTQRLGRDNFQEQDMRLIAEILECPFQLNILSGEVQPQERAAARFVKTAHAAEHENEAAAAEEYENQTAAAEEYENQTAAAEEYENEIPAAEEYESAAPAAETSGEAALSGVEEPESVTQETAAFSYEEPAAFQTEEATSVQEEELGSGERDMTIGELYEIHEELSELEENAKAGEPVEAIKEELEKPKKERFSFFRRRHTADRTREENTHPPVREPEPESTVEDSEESFGRGREHQEAESYSERQEESRAFEPVISHNDAEEDTQVGEINPYTGREYQSNSVRMHPSRIGYVQVYDRSIHKWTDMTEWAFLGYQERKKALLGKAYEPPIYLD
ncbi:hypothetical protein B5F07_05185 [Lachnoclostridium sp. An169]|uniref:hypothetical protein n=1 Tax=Lachnoclostridium sp. An169 TaxID=1965569 RepID=UPI000B36DFD2|nr:hypothetical protein [Lachnoclostridium sp. An169]OUP85085.1 hypothetical protein B5F07_05185 [Lachnoclostridium sp. An169]